MYVSGDIVSGFGGLLTTLIFILSSCTAECPTRNDVLSLDLNQFTGEWFVVSGTPVNGKTLSKCGHFVVTSMSADTLVMNYTALSYRGNNPVAFIVNVRLDDDVTGNWQLQGSNRILGPFKHRFIDVKYDSYFAMIVCGEPPNLPVGEFSMIWSREKTLSPTVLDKLKNKVGSFINRDKILDADHSGC